MYWLFGVAAVIGLALLWGVAAFLYWVGVTRILTALLVIAGIVWVIVFGWAACDGWRLTQPLG